MTEMSGRAKEVRARGKNPPRRELGCAGGLGKEDGME